MDSPFYSLISGATAGLAVDLGLYPLDTLKTRLQSHEGFQKSGGFRSLYRGMSSVALGSAPSSALFFLTYSTLDSYWHCESSWCDAARACCGEFAACLVRVPTEVVKQNAQVSSERSALKITVDLWQQSGFRAFYRGFSTTLAREIPFAFVEYPLWEYLKKRIAKDNQRATPIQSAFCGSIAGVIAAGLVFVFRVVECLNTQFSGVDVTFKIASGDFTVKDAPIGDTILDVVINNDVPIEGYGACEGTLACSTCHVILEPEHFERCGKISENELDILDYASQLHDRSRLGCQVKLTEADKPAITLTVPSERRDVRTI
ncbi:hypothetical protein M3Y94_00806000 [Aphelenchoides besseyi]|nr:hypothetical protein M3Y94_00806000 [Aphelenchoides besseyi]